MSENIGNSISEKKIGFNNIVENETELNNTLNNVNIEENVRSKFRNNNFTSHLNKDIIIDSIEVVMKNLRKRRALKKQLLETN